ncbi:hypothetical protein P175DRAFT_0561008 [Aspergillus ochraceoroseus IBT 24754]|uniref:Uncharacterized protein n=1 Tax=Aspergillus ochraceoroseus IBT 24754 TaxID=1392256 RepID=A0A2T5LM18_9EURO|nr:uncharacterized protein P175DRAFT_0561008 [Aspergillus ochraceoroseus IBT 24754]PTU17323.1 hypothetical protein P175DRAFT_0561008 [Aspergillus ochraceoroseus IBT 24754]
MHGTLASSIKTDPAYFKPNDIPAFHHPLSRLSSIGSLLERAANLPVTVAPKLRTCICVETVPSVSSSSVVEFFETERKEMEALARIIRKFPNWGQTFPTLKRHSTYSFNAQANDLFYNPHIRSALYLYSPEPFKACDIISFDSKYCSTSFKLCIDDIGLVSPIEVLNTRD